MKNISETREHLLTLVINAGLTVCKFIVGTNTHCAALVADGFKDLSGAVRSGLRLGLHHLHRDVKEHRERPAGARYLEKVLLMTVFIAIVWMGIQAFAGSVRDILNEHNTLYTPALYIISVISIVIKAFMAHQKRSQGRRQHNESLIHDGIWSAIDAGASGAVICAAFTDHTFHVDIDPWVGTGIAAVIILFGILTVLHRRIHRAQAAS